MGLAQPARLRGAAPGNVDLDDYLEAADGADVSFEGRYPEEFLVNPGPRTIPAWHLVGGTDPIDASQLTGAEPDDGYPVLLRDWIRQDGLKCLKAKLRGNDAAWDIFDFTNPFESGYFFYIDNSLLDNVAALFFPTDRDVL